MSIALLHLIGLVAHPLVDDSLVDAGSGQVGGKRMPEDVEAPDFFPFATRQRAFEMVPRLGCR